MGGVCNQYPMPFDSAENPSSIWTLDKDGHRRAMTAPLCTSYFSAPILQLRSTGLLPLLDACVVRRP